jgi:hypothetical protein
LVPTRNLNLIWANSHGFERKNYIRIWAECRPARRLREILKSQVDLTPPFGGGHPRSNIVLVSSIKGEVKKKISPMAGIFLASQPT